MILAAASCGGPRRREARVRLCKGPKHRPQPPPPEPPRRCLNLGAIPRWKNADRWRGVRKIQPRGRAMPSEVVEKVPRTGIPETMSQSPGRCRIETTSRSAKKNDCCMRFHGSDSFNSLLAPRITDLPLRRKLVPILTIVFVITAGQVLAWGILAFLDPGRGHESAVWSLFAVILVPMGLFMPYARPQARRHWVILHCATLVSIVLGMLGLHLSLRLSMRLFAPITEPTLLGELPAQLIAYFAGAGIAIGIWLLVRRATRAAGLW